MAELSKCERLLTKGRRRFLTLEPGAGTMPGRSDTVISPQTEQHGHRQANNSVIAVNNENYNGAHNYDSYNHNDVNHVPSQHFNRCACVCVRINMKVMDSFEAVFMI